MALKDRIAFGMSLPHRSPDTIDMSAVRQVAQRADALDFSDLWVTENTLDHVFCFDPIVILTYAAAITTRIRVGVSVVVLPVRNPIHLAHEIATLDYASNGRAVLGVGLGRDNHYTEFQVPRERRIRRFLEEVELIKALWTQSKVDYRGSLYQLEGGRMAPKPVQKPHPPIWLGGGHPDAIKRAAVVADGWMGSGGSSVAEFSRSVPALRAALEKASRDPAKFPISKRVFMSVHERADVAYTELDRWFTTVYHNPKGAEASGVHGTPEQVRERLEQLVEMGANHLLLNPVCRHAEQLEALAKIVGLA
jgi:probable F420-dependent oxidoreductase